MSTEIPQADLPTLSVKIDTSSAWVRLSVQREDCLPTPAYVWRADFLAAVEAELGVRLVPADAVVIDTADFPGVTIDDQQRVRGGARSFILNPEDTHESLLLDIVALVALDEYLAARPPVDEAQVKAMAQVLRDTGVGLEPNDGARRLIATGKVTVQP